MNIPPLEFSPVASAETTPSEPPTTPKTLEPPESEKMTFDLNADRPNKRRNTMEAFVKRPKLSLPELPDHTAYASTCKKDGPNKGRTFISVQKPGEKESSFYKWTSWGKGQDQKLCSCGKQPNFGISSKETSMGKRFNSCKYCNYFDWNSCSKQNKIKCDCPHHPSASERVVKKDGMNQGRTFYVCADQACEFFEWE